MAPGGDASAALPSPVAAAPAALRAAAAVFGGSLCDRCLGRLAGRAEPRGDPLGKGRALRSAAGLEPAPADERDCAWCEGFFTETEHFAALAADAVRGYGFGSFLVATKMHPDVLASEARALAALGPHGEAFEPLKMELNRVLGALLVERLGRRVEMTRPDLIVQVDPYFDEVRVTTSNLFLYGRYRKYDRTIPQTKWPCRGCKGSGCAECDGTGQRYPVSVESLVAAVPVSAFAAKDASFHGAGREDIDALMLGGGRPFVLELKEPLLREPHQGDPAALDAPVFDIAELERRINAHAAPRVEVLDLRPADRHEVAQVKNAATEKAYRAHVEAEAEVPRAALEQAIAAVTAAPLAQRTPKRVAHRRADKVRRRRVLAVRIITFGEHERAGVETGEAAARPPAAAPETTDRFTLEIEAEAGTYIKELVHGDEGRTQPSLAALLAVPMRVAYLDVVGVADPFEAQARRGAPSAGG